MGVEVQKNPHSGMPSAWLTTHQEGAKSHHRRRIAEGLSRDCCILAVVNIWLLQ